ncbi:MAG TPA: hypothetical protein VNG90_02450 [Candidatus Acidoferrum sp.]|nr:hypothetical protein [Candidatus Acidoferrum sp.]
MLDKKPGDFDILNPELSEERLIECAINIFGVLASAKRCRLLAFLAENPEATVEAVSRALQAKSVQADLLLLTVSGLVTRTWSIRYRYTVAVKAPAVLMAAFRVVFGAPRRSSLIVLLRESQHVSLRVLSLLRQPNSVDILQTLRNSSGPIGRIELQASVCLEQSSLSVAIAKLMAGGIVGGVPTKRRRKGESRIVYTLKDHTPLLVKLLFDIGMKADAINELINPKTKE